MLKILLIIILSLVHFAENAGLNFLSLSLHDDKDALRPVAALLSSGAAKSFSAGITSNIADNWPESKSIEEVKIPANYIEFDTRALCRTYKGTIKDVPEEFWDWIAEFTDTLWLKVPWQTDTFSEKLIAYWHRDAGVETQASGYDISEYKINNKIGTYEEFKRVVNYLNKRGVKVYVDFIPNQIIFNSPLAKPPFVMTIKGGPEDAPPALYEKLKSEWTQKDIIEWLGDTNRRSSPSFQDRNISILHSKLQERFGLPAPNLSAINYMNKETRDFMIHVIVDVIADLTNNGGARVDLAHLTFRDIMYNNFADALGINRDKFDEMYPREFYEELREELDKRCPEMSFLAEAYEWDKIEYPWDGNIGILQKLGFVTYDQRTYNIIRSGDIGKLRWWLFEHAPESFFRQSAVYPENHDTEPAVKVFGSLEKAMVVTAILGAIPGPLLVTGRFLLGGEYPDKAIYLFEYPDITKDKAGINEPLIELLKFLRQDVFRKGKFYSAKLKTIKQQDRDLSIAEIGLVPFVRHLNGDNVVVFANVSDLPLSLTADLNDIFYEYDRKYKGAHESIKGMLTKKLHSEGVNYSKSDDEIITVNLPANSYGIFYFSGSKEKLILPAELGKALKSSSAEIDSPQYSGSTEAFASCPAVKKRLALCLKEIDAAA